MTADTLPLQNGVVVWHGDLTATDANSNSTTAKKFKESEWRRRRRKQKKNNEASQQGLAFNTEAGHEIEDDEVKENADSQTQVFEQVSIEHVPEKPLLDDDVDDEFRKILEKFSFQDMTGSEENDKKEEPAQNADSKKADSDSDEEEQDN